MQPEIVQRIRQTLHAESLDALICISPENVAYTAGFTIPSQPLMRWRHAITVVHADGREGIVCVDMEESTVRKLSVASEIRVWREFSDHPMKILADLLRDWNLESSRVGIELAYIPAADFSELKKTLPDITLEGADSILDKMRQIKSGSEIETIKKLSRISDTAIVEALQSVSAGDTEMDIASALTKSIYTQGAQDFKLMIVATGERSQLPNVGPTHRKLQPGDICRIEIFSVIDGYHAGVCRTAFVDEPPKNAEHIYSKLVKSKYTIMDAIRPGTRTKDVYEIYKKEVADLGLPLIPFVAHSLGVNLHESPYLGPHDNNIIEKDMVFSMEPLVYESGHGFGMQIKDMVHVTNKGAYLMSDVAQTDTMIRIPG